MLKFSNSTFSAKGANKKDKVYGLTINGAEDVVVENCSFDGTGYSAILNNCESKVDVKGCEFSCDNIYNPIECSQSVSIGNMDVVDCEFNGIPGNNFVNIYNVKNGGEFNIERCEFHGSCDNNIVRLSNNGSHVASFNIDDCAYEFVSGEPTEYTNFLLCQDYTNKSGKKQDFSQFSVAIANLACEGKAINAKQEPVKGGVYYVYEDGKGVITGENDPKITIR